MIAGQVPPEQLARFVCTLDAQLCARHCVVEYVQAVGSVPEHVPPQVPSVVHAERPVRGVPDTVLHVPTESASLHA